jgi:hypothetical protein
MTKAVVIETTHQSTKSTTYMDACCEQNPLLGLACEPSIHTKAIMWQGPALFDTPCMCCMHATASCSTLSVAAASGMLRMFFISYYTNAYVCVTNKHSLSYSLSVPQCSCQSRAICQLQLLASDMLLFAIRSRRHGDRTGAADASALTVPCTCFWPPSCAGLRHAAQCL